MAAVIRLQDLTTNTVTSAATVVQRLAESADVGNYSRVAMQVRVAVAASSDLDLYLEHAAVLDEDAFIRVDASLIDLTTSGNQYVALGDLLRFCRWRLESAATDDATFTIDLVCREY